MGNNSSSTAAAKYQAPRQRYPRGNVPVTEKSKDLKKSLRNLLSYCRGYLPAIIVAVILASFGAILQIIGPNLIKDITNEIAKGLPMMIGKRPVIRSIDIKAVEKIAWTLVFIYAGSTLMNYVQSIIMATMTQKISKSMRTDISQKINRVPLSYFDKTSYGDVLSRVTNDIDAIGFTLNQSVGTLVNAITMFIGSLVMMIYNSFTLAMTAVLSSLLGFVVMTVVMKKSQKFFIAQQANLGEVNGYVEEIYTAHKIVKSYNASDDSRREFERINKKLYESAWKSQFFSGLMTPLMQFIGNFGYVMVCVVGAILTLNNQISFGVIVAFMIYIRLFTQPLSQMAQAANNLQRTAAAAERVFEFLDEKELSDESNKKSLLSDIHGDVEFNHVRFGYTKDEPVIKDFSVKIHSGQRVAIVGPTGAGKTTIVNLLMRFYETDSGEILIDGIPTNKVPRENVHEQFCMVLQDSWIFEGSIKDNVRFNKTDVKDEDIVNACKAVGLHHFVSTLPNGYDTVLDDKASLSEGQKQLITIARAMIQNAPLLILDEATSSVDTRTERIVQAAMDKLTEGRTSFVIAHRLSTIKNADLILVMRDGDIVESGNHEELLELGGYYAQLYNSQFE